MRVEALMHTGALCPVVRADARMRDVIYEMSSKGLGMTCVIDREDETLLGIITDGDLRRRMERGGEMLGLCAADVMTRNPVSVQRTTLAAEALNIMEQRKITSIVVADGDQTKRVAGVLHLHDLWRMEMF
jgi:arabinose-5-phosphate isomerase